MAKVIYEDATKDITIEDCTKLWESGGKFYFEDGKKVVFDTEA